MNVKILLVPFLVLLIIVNMIWFVYPAYSDPLAGGMKEKKVKLKAEEDKVAALSAEVGNIKSLSDDIAKNKAKRDILFQYLPESPNEERIINDLNYLASENKVNLSVISINQISAQEAPKSAPVPMPVAPQPATIGPEEGDMDAVLPIPAVPAVRPTPSTVTVSVSVTGNYQDIKSLIEKIYKLKRFNSIQSAEIKHASDTDGKISGLALDLALVFDFFKKTGPAGGYENVNFPRGRFDMKIIDELEKRNTQGPDIDLGELGKEDPFSV